MCEFLDEFPWPHPQYSEPLDSSSVLCSHPACSLFGVCGDGCMWHIKKKKNTQQQPTKSFKQKEQERIRGNQLARMKLAGFSQ